MLRITRYGHLEHIHWGGPADMRDAEALSLKRTSVYGSSIMYKAGDELYCLDRLPMEWSGEGRGDYRFSPIECRMPDGSYTTDFIYASHDITEGGIPLCDGLPGAYGGGVTLTILTRDKASGAELTHIYTAYPENNVLTRRCVLKNGGEGTLNVKRLMSYTVDMPERELTMMTFTGGWNCEAHRRDVPVSIGRITGGSRTGFSSNRQNPGFILRGNETTEEAGHCWGFNLIYSGNHYESVECDGQGLVRVMAGISPERFSWELTPGDRFETPEAVLSYSDNGLNGLSGNMHDFCNCHIVRGEWADKERPVLVNSWEAFMFDFDRDKLLGLARKAGKLGAELFVLDDGWFGKRNNDKAGLGDYVANKKKLPRGLADIAGHINELGMDFGLWFEPEAVNMDSKLYRAHPDWALTDGERESVFGRNELLLDLTRPEVRDYIVFCVGKTLDSANIKYVKWDMNRHMAGKDGAFAHKYILGLYEVLHRIFDNRPEILLETCSSGGNRFDLGMLCFSPQIWASDDTDPIERLDIQKGLSYLYPLSAMGAHVSAAPHTQTLRNTPLSTRFNAACFGSLGYELDLTSLKPVEEREIRGQIEFYKKHRRTFQFGEFRRRNGLHDGQEGVICINKDGWEAVCGHFRRLVHAAPGFDILPASGLSPEYLYKVETKPQKLRLNAFGNLIAYALPVKVSGDGTLVRKADELYGLPDCVESYEATGLALNIGIRLNNSFNGTGYNEHIRLPGDFGSELYVITKIGKA